MANTLPNNATDAISKPYFISASVLTFILPVTAFFAEHFISATPLTFEIFGKWFIFSAVGLRLFVAGVRQSTKPAFTAKEIFHMQGTESFPVIRELGFANICFGLTGIISLFKPEWRVVSAFASGIYYAFAAILHIIKKPAGKNEQFALWTDLLICTLLLIYLAKTI